MATAKKATTKKATATVAEKVTADFNDDLDAVVPPVEAVEETETAAEAIPEVIADVTDDLDGRKLNGFMIGLHFKDIEISATPYLETAILQGIAEKLQFRRVTSQQFIDNLQSQAKDKMDSASGETNHVDLDSGHLEGLNDRQIEMVMRNEEEIETINAIMQDLHAFFGVCDEWNQKLLRRSDSEVKSDLERAQARKNQNAIIQNKEARDWVKEKRNERKAALALLAQ